MILQENIFFFYLSILFKKNKIGNKNSQVNNITTLINVLFSVFLLAYIQDYMTNLIIYDIIDIN